MKKNMIKKISKLKVVTIGCGESNPCIIHNKMEQTSVNDLVNIAESEMKAIFEDIENESEEVISSPIRFYGVSMERIKRVFEKHGIKIEANF